MSSLQFNVSQLLKDGIGSTRVYKFEAPQLDLEDGVAHNVTGDVKFTLTNFGIVAAGHAHADVDLTCARCLEPFSAPTDVAFEEEFRPSIDILTGLPAETVESDTAFSISGNHIIDLSEPLRQNFLVATEMVPVCRPDCLGLCPTCGTNRNVNPCTCDQPEEATPFAALRSLLNTEES